MRETLRVVFGVLDINKKQDFNIYLEEITENIEFYRTRLKGQRSMENGSKKLIILDEAKIVRDYDILVGMLKEIVRNNNILREGSVFDLEGVKRTEEIVDKIEIIAKRIKTKGINDILVNDGILEIVENKFQI